MGGMQKKNLFESENFIQIDGNISSSFYVKWKHGNIEHTLN